MAERLLSQNHQAELANKLFTSGIFGVKAGAELVELKSGRMSPHYADLRKGLGNHQVKTTIVGSLTMQILMYVDAQLLPEAVPLKAAIAGSFDAVIGIPEAMTSYASSVGDALKLPTPAMRADFSGGGNKSPILGTYLPGARVALLDDVITQGEEKIRAVEALRALGLVPTAMFVVLDREEGGIPAVEDATGIKVYPAIGVSGLMNAMQGTGHASEAEYMRVKSYIGNYGEPHAQHAMGYAPQ